MVTRLRAASVESVELWETGDVAVRRGDRKRINHPALGVVDINCQNLFSEDGRQRLQFFTAPAGSPAVEQLGLLGVLGIQGVRWRTVRTIHIGRKRHTRPVAGGTVLPAQPSEAGPRSMSVAEDRRRRTATPTTTTTSAAGNVAATTGANWSSTVATAAPATSDVRTAALRQGGRPA